MKKIFYLFLFLIIGLGFSACTDLEEQHRKDLTAVDALIPDAALESSYNSMRLPYQDQSRYWAAQEHTSDEAMGPTRGPDWDDNGIWRSLHNHTWDADHAFLGDTFSELLQIIFSTSNILLNEPSPQTAAESRFLRAFVLTSLLDGWGQVPYRDDFQDLLSDAKVLQPAETIDLILSELDAIVADLPDGPASVANKDAAVVLEMKTLLNKGMYLNRENPTFDNADMMQVVSLANQLIDGGKYSLASNYFDNFAPNNDQISTENIFTAFNDGGVSSGNVRSRWFCGLHYNQNPSGWNGFCTLGDFYDSFESDDPRAHTEYAGMKEVGGINSGFLIGQQVDGDGNELMDRKMNPLAFTKEVALTEAGDNLEITGVRVMKYVIDYESGDNSDNDYVYYRYADVLMMKAEAMLRMGDETGALAIVNDIRSSRGASMLDKLDNDILLAERGREFYWEGFRRTDLLRFGKFLDAWQEKPASGPERLLFPIPARSLASNPNLVQNPGY